MPRKHSPGGCLCCSPAASDSAIFCATCVTLVEDCGHTTLTAGTVTLTQGGTTHSGSIASEVGGLTITAPGSGYPDGWYPLGFSGGGGSGAAGWLEVIGGQVAHAYLTAGGSGYTSAPAVTFSASSGSGAVLIAGINYLFCAYDLAGSWNWSATSSGYTTATGTVAACTTATAHVVPATFPAGTGSGARSGCDPGVAPPDATVTISQGGSSTTVDVDSGGTFSFPGGLFSPGGGLITVTIHDPSGLFVDKSETLDWSGDSTCGNPSIAAPGWIVPTDFAAADELCIIYGAGSQCPLPMTTDSLTLNSALYGSCTLTHSLDGGGNHQWTGSITYSSPGCDPHVYSADFTCDMTCPAKTVTINFVLNSSGLGATWLMANWSGNYQNPDLTWTTRNVWCPSDTTVTALSTFATSTSGCSTTTSYSVSSGFSGFSAVPSLSSCPPAYHLVFAVSGPSLAGTSLPCNLFLAGDTISVTQP